MELRCPSSSCILLYALPLVDSPREVELSSEDKQYYTGDTITCSAVGNPDPEIRWRNLATDEVIEGDTLIITGEMAEEHQVFECIAFNEVKGQIMNATRTIDFDVISEFNATIYPLLLKISNQGFSMILLL